MLNIEVIRFEAQDVITASVPAVPMFPARPIQPVVRPNQPTVKPIEPAPAPVDCTCTQAVCAFATMMGDVELHSGCEATNHTCGY